MEKQNPFIVKYYKGLKKSVLSKTSILQSLCSCLLWLGYRMKNKVCILTSVHPPFDVRIFHKEAKSLVKAGYDVTLIAQHDKEEIVDGVKIINLQKPRNRIERMTKTVSELYQKALRVDADIYHFHDPELIPVGKALKKRGKAIIYDVHEDYYESIKLKKVIFHQVSENCYPMPMLRMKIMHAGNFPRLSRRRKK